MATFTFNQDCKYTVWRRTRFQIDAESREEAIQKVKEIYANKEDFYGDIAECTSEEIGCMSGEETIYDTLELLSMEENGGEPTTEVELDGELVVSF